MKSGVRWGRGTLLVALVARSAPSLAQQAPPLPPVAAFPAAPAEAPGGAPSAAPPAPSPSVESPPAGSAPPPGSPPASSPAAGEPPPVAAPPAPGPAQFGQVPPSPSPEQAPPPAPPAPPAFDSGENWGGPEPEERGKIVRPRSFVALDTTFHTQSLRGESITVLAPILRGSFLVENWTIEPELPFVYYDVDAGQSLFVAKDSGVVVGNPSLAGRYHVQSHRSDVWAGIGVAFPVAQLQNDDTHALEKAVGYGAALASRGVWNEWSYFPNSLVFWLPAGARYVDPKGIDVGMEAAVALYVHVGNGERDPLGGGQIGFHFGYASEQVESGLRLRVVRLAGDVPHDFQASIEPYARFLFSGGFVEPSLIMNVGKPFGDFFDEGAIWGFRFAAGARF